MLDSARLRGRRDRRQSLAPMRDRATYVARVEADDMIRVYADDWEHPAAIIDLPPGASIRAAMEAAGWRPTGRRAPSSGWGSIYVEPTRRR
jgi:hypothetical protein